MVNIFELCSTYYFYYSWLNAVKKLICQLPRFATKRIVMFCLSFCMGPVMFHCRKNVLILCRKGENASVTSRSYRSTLREHSNSLHLCFKIQNSSNQKEGHPSFQSTPTRSRKHTRHVEKINIPLVMNPLNKSVGLIFEMLWFSLITVSVSLSLILSQYLYIQETWKEKNCRPHMSEKKNLSPHKFCKKKNCS